MWKISKRIGAIKGIYINETNIKGYGQFPAKLNTAHGEVASKQIEFKQFNSYFSAFIVSKLLLMYFINQNIIP